MGSLGPGGLALILAVMAGAMALALYAGRDASASRRIIVEFAFRIALPFVCVLGLPLIVIGQFTDLDPRVWQALIAGVVIAAGWLTAAVFAALTRARDRDEKLRDYHKALFAEIRDALATLYSDGEADAQAAALLDRMRADPDFIPFVAREEHDRVYAALLDEIEVLPRQTIDAVVAYYSLMGSITKLAEDLRGDGYAALPQARRIVIYEDYLDMRRRAYRYGLYTLELIEAFAEGGRASAERVTARFNSPDAARSGQEPGSE